MAKHRYLNTKFWDDHFISQLEPKAKLLFLYYLTNPMTNLCGVYEITMKRISFDTGLLENDILSIGYIFWKNNKIAYLDGFIAIKNHIKHQSKNNDKIIKAINNELLHVPKMLKKWVLCEIDTLSIPYPYPIDGQSHININLNSNLNSMSPSASNSDSNESASKELSKIDPDKELKTKIEQSFKAISGEFASYAKERQNIKRIIEVAKRDCPDRSEEYIRAMLEKFKELTEGTDKFYSKLEFSPSKLIGCWMNVRKLLKGSFKNQLSPEEEEAIERACRK